MSYLMDKLKEGVREVKNQVNRYDEIEIQVRHATSSDKWMVPNSELEKIARATNDHTTYPKLLNMLWKRLTDTEHLMHVQKSLILIEYLLRHGHERFIRDALARKKDIQTLKEYRYYDDQNEEKGGVARQKATKVYALMTDEQALSEARKQAERLRGISKTSMSSDTVKQPNEKTNINTSNGVQSSASPQTKQQPNPNDNLDPFGPAIDEDDPFGEIKPIGSTTSNNFDPFDEQPSVEQPSSVEPTQNKPKKKKKKKKVNTVTASSNAGLDDFDWGQETPGKTNNNTQQAGEVDAWPAFDDASSTNNNMNFDPFASTQSNNTSAVSQNNNNNDMFDMFSMDNNNNNNNNNNTNLFFDQNASISTFIEPQRPQEQPKQSQTFQVEGSMWGNTSHLSNLDNLGNLGNNNNKQKRNTTADLSSEFNTMSFNHSTSNMNTSHDDPFANLMSVPQPRRVSLSAQPFQQQQQQQQFNQNQNNAFDPFESQSSVNHNQQHDNPFLSSGFGQSVPVADTSPFDNKPQQNSTKNDPFASFAQF